VAKQKILFVCSSCGAEYARWAGRCTSCDSWNTIHEVTVDPSAKKKTNASKPSAVILSKVEYTGVERIMTPVSEFNLVCGGGIVPGSVILIGGEPGIGKSTLSLAIAGSLKSLYVSGEESAIQIKQRAERLGVNTANILVSTQTDVDDIETLIKEHRPNAIFIDSVQTMSCAHIPVPAGSVSQVRESAARLSDIAKSTNIPLFLIGHITKEGSIAGPKILEHIVDTVLYFEGDFTREYRVLRAFKNRYGSVNEIGLFKMTARGLEEVKDRNALFLNPSSTDSAGSSVSAAIEGSRTILFEVQSLAIFSTFANPRRMSDGLDQNRLILIAAVLEKHTGLKCSNFDLFLNVAGGFSINETSADLAVALAVASSMKEVPIPRGTAFLGEISLSGEVRPVSQPERRVQELVRTGYTRIILSKKDAAECRGHKIEGELTAVATIAEAIAKTF
jgi:DNA repair protein RadA/Sms